ncbi:S-adenosyl-L-methionine-dependent methyltransferase [Coniochaeta ligniaria NRRL 30616]|uniref:S-adenosyl-L-methionine-dependent methyltransferase n=1 Tax=Coniochaeta ligniaria NRRL 30616 TaxID=1408157 RepID=A0A1J7I4X2_9PEZI|nr:S-adenosyl-L-methionine-dependent methyltransferase [Coniochaeta ligniaria NRRL 30616]
MASREETFRSFTEKQGANYAQNRRDYHPDLYQTIIDHHTSTGGKLDTLLDVGCGPGTATRSLAPRFTHAFGIDPSEGMISTAQTLGGVTATSNPVRFEVSTAEELGSQLSPPIQDGSVDLITAATAAHWFDLPGFWKRAAQVLKPGGSVALWTSATMTVSPSTPNYAAVQAAIQNMAKAVEQYVVSGNRMSHELYAGMPLPWTLPSPVPEFDEASFLRKEWGTGPDSEPGDRFYVHQQPATLDMLEKMLGTTSPITRWREAHPEAAGTERDVVRILRKEIEELFREAGVEQGKELLQGGVSGVLLMVKRKA